MERQVRILYFLQLRPQVVVAVELIQMALLAVLAVAVAVGTMFHATAAPEIRLALLQAKEIMAVMV
jgi:hypothetical protein